MTFFNSCARIASRVTISKYSNISKKKRRAFYGWDLFIKCGTLQFSFRLEKLFQTNSWALRSRHKRLKEMFSTKKVYQGHNYRYDVCNQRLVGTPWWAFPVLWHSTFTQITASRQPKTTCLFLNLIYLHSPAYFCWKIGDMLSFQCTQLLLHAVPLYFALLDNFFPVILMV